MTIDLDSLLDPLRWFVWRLRFILRLRKNKAAKPNKRKHTPIKYLAMHMKEFSTAKATPKPKR
jgi:hypothetical protein